MVFDRRPCFYRIFFAKSPTKGLRIPDQFVKDNLVKIAAERAVLTGPSRGRWPVEIMKTQKEELFLGEGWERFVGDNFIQDGYFLLFRYEGEMSFTVDVFAKNGISLPLNDATVGSSSGMKRGRSGEREVVRETLNDSSKREKNLQETPDVHRGKSTGLQKKSPSECRPAGKIAASTSKEEADSFTSQFPFFKLVLRDYNVRRNSYMVNLPKYFTDKHFQKDNKNKVILRSVEGSASELHYRTYDGKYCFGKGWTRVVEENQLKVGDICIFELVGEMELQFHIFRK